METKKKPRRSPRKGMVWDPHCEEYVYPEEVNIFPEEFKDSLRCLATYIDHDDTVSWHGQIYEKKEWDAKIKGWQNKHPIIKEKCDLKETESFKKTRAKVYRNLCWEGAIMCFSNDPIIPKPYQKTFAIDIFGNVICKDARNNTLLFFDVDHIFPWKRGGLTDPRNLEALHFHVNRFIKREKFLQELNPLDMRKGLSAYQLRKLFEEAKLQVDNKKRLMDEKFIQERAIALDRYEDADRRLVQASKRQQEIDLCRKTLNEDIKCIMALSKGTDTLADKLQELVVDSQDGVSRAEKLVCGSRARLDDTNKCLEDAKARLSSAGCFCGITRRKRPLKADMKRLEHELLLRGEELSRHETELDRNKKELVRLTTELARCVEETRRLVLEESRKKMFLKRIEGDYKLSTIEVEQLEADVKRHNSEIPALSQKVDAARYDEFLELINEKLVQKLKEYHVSETKKGYADFAEAVSGKDGAELFKFLFPSILLEIVNKKFD